MWSHWILLLVCFPTSLLGANILFYHGPISSRSHNVAAVSIMEKLVAQGHNVTLFGAYPFLGTAKVNHFCPKALKEESDFVLTFFGAKVLINRLETSAKELIYHTLDMSLDMSSRVAHSQESIDFIKNNAIDLVVIDSMYNEFMYAVAHYWKAKVILFQPCSTLYPWELAILNIPDEFSWLPQFDTTPTPDYGFFNRLSTQVLTYLTFWKFESVYLPTIEEYSRKILGMPDMPPIKELMRKNIDLIFANFDSWDHFPRPLPPYVISVSGARFNKSRKVAPLPEDIQAWLNKGTSKDFIYISFGSIVNVAAAPERFVNMFFSALRQLPVKVLLKWNGDTPKDMPPNVLTREWYPQLDVLGHKNIRGYVMQGGQNSVQEAIVNGVPMLVIPLFGEQDINARFVRDRGLGKNLEFHTLTTETLRDTIIELISNPLYAQKVKQMSQVFLNSPVDQTENAVRWIDRVLRGDDLSYLKPPSTYQSWWTYRLLDTLLVAFLIVLLVPLLAIGMVFRLLSLCKPKTTKDVKSQEKNKQSKKNR